MKPDFEKEASKICRKRYFVNQWLISDVASALRQSYEDGQKDMRERAANTADRYSKMPMCELDIKQMTTWGWASTIADAIRNLKLEDGK